MNRREWIGSAAIAVWGAARAFGDEPDGAVELFDGATLEGWEGDPAFFQVRDGAIVGGSLDRPVPHNAFLCTKREFSDFELDLEFKLIGLGANAGVQFRSSRIPNHHEVSGYQADLGAMYWGCLYDESRRNRVLARPKDEKALMKSLRGGDWNTYRIRAQGPRIQLWINDIATVDYTEKEEGMAPAGVIGVQIHGGPPSEAWYRKIRLRELV